VTAVNNKAFFCEIIVAIARVRERLTRETVKIPLSRPKDGSIESERGVTDLREPRGRAKREKREVALAPALVVNEK
jgi:hypothetical protein